MTTEEDIEYMESYRNELPWLASGMAFFLSKINFLKMFDSINNLFLIIACGIIYNRFINREHEFTIIKMKNKRKRLSKLYKKLKKKRDYEKGKEDAF